MGWNNKLVVARMCGRNFKTRIKVVLACALSTLVAPALSAQSLAPRLPLTAVSPQVVTADLHRRNFLWTPDKTLAVRVGNYDDCRSIEKVANAVAQLNRCIPNVHWFMGHNPGVFTPLARKGVGAVVIWADSDGGVHTFKIVQARVVSEFKLLSRVSPDVAAQFQMCVHERLTVLDRDGYEHQVIVTRMRVLDAIETNYSPPQ